MYFRLVAVVVLVAVMCSASPYVFALLVAVEGVVWLFAVRFIVGDGAVCPVVVLFDLSWYRSLCGRGVGFALHPRGGGPRTQARYLEKGAEHVAG